MIKNLCAALGASLLLAYAPISASAADLNCPSANADGPSEQWRPSIWQGMYIGLSAGYGWGDSEHFYDRNDNHGTANQSLEGGLGSVTLGYNHLVSPNFLIGVEGDLGFMDLGADDKVTFDGHVWRPQFDGLWGTVRARAGFLWATASSSTAQAGWRSCRSARSAMATRPGRPPRTGTSAQAGSLAADWSTRSTQG